jgi:hypothetical protein
MQMAEPLIDQIARLRGKSVIFITYSVPAKKAGTVAAIENTGSNGIRSTVSNPTILN